MLAMAVPRAGHAQHRDVYFRAGGAVVAPVTSSSELELAGVDGPASLAVHDGPIKGSGATIDSAIIPAIIVGYVLPIGERTWSVEAILGLPFTVKFEATGTLANMSIAPTALGIPTGVGALGPQLGEAKATPIVVTAVYRPIDRGVVLPYVGAGASVLFTSDAKVTNPTLTAVRQPDMEISPAPGLVLQAGLEAPLWHSVYARLDAKFILTRAHAEVRNIAVETPGLPLFERVDVGTAKMNLWVNPFIVQAGVGCDFDLW
jgi:outer membrane protein W